MPDAILNICGKVCHLDVGSARQQVKQLKRSGLDNRPRLRPYFCPLCHAWHVGHPRKRRGVGVG